MPVQHEENKASCSRGNQESRHPESYGDGDTGVRFVSRSSGSESIRICGENRTGQNTPVESKRAIIGGAIDELVDNILEQLADSENRTEKLKAQLEKVRSIRQHIESPDDIK
jgi:hypothetical protein